MICDVTYVSHGPIDPKVPGDDAFNRESRANARLIAAAPTLLEALERAQSCLATRIPGGVLNGDETMSVIRQAISAATGQQETES